MKIVTDSFSLSIIKTKNVIGRLFLLVTFLQYVINSLFLLVAFP